MRRRSRTGPERAKSHRRKTKTQKLRGGLKTTRLRNSSAADDKTQSDVTQLIRERDEALEREKATAEVLRVISSSPGELEPVFDAILENATRICEAKFGTLFLREGDLFQAAALHNAPRAFAEMRKRHPVRPGPKTALSRVLRTKQTVHVPDFTAEEAYLERDPLMVTAVELGGFRSMLCAPMLKENEVLGAISIYRQEVKQRQFLAGRPPALPGLMIPAPGFPPAAVLQAAMFHSHIPGLQFERSTCLRPRPGCA